MPEQTLVKWNEETILEHLKKIAKEQLNLTPEQIETIGPDVPLMDALQLDSLAQVVDRASLAGRRGRIPDEV